MQKLPPFFKEYFWDVDFKKLDLKKYPYFIIERVLEYGDQKAIKWLKKNFTLRQIKRFIKKSRIISPKTANFWSLILDIPKDEVLCLSKFYLEARRKFWPH